MTNSKKIEILRKRNSELLEELNEIKKENTELKDKYKSSFENDTAIEFKKKVIEFDNCIVELKNQRDEYRKLINELSSLKTVLKKRGFTEEGFKMPIYKIIILRTKKTLLKCIRKDKTAL